MNKLTSVESTSILYAYKEKAFAHGRPGKTTYFSMDGCYGGVIRLLPEHEDEFRTKYVEDIQFQRHLYLSEQKTEIYAMHFDLDGILMTPEQAKALLLLIQEVVKCFYPKDMEKNMFRMYVLDTRLSDKKEPHFAKPKTNMHVILSFLDVNNEQAMSIRDACVHKANIVLPNVEWNDVFDSMIYERNGLRMPGSRKCDKCPSCENDKKKRSYCFECKQVGKIDLGRAYNISAVFDDDGNLDEVETQLCFSNPHHMMRRCCVRRIDKKCTTPGFKLYSGCPVADVSCAALIDQKRQEVIKSFESLPIDKTAEYQEAILPQLEKVPSENPFVKLREEERRKASRSFQIEVKRFSHEFEACLEEMRKFNDNYASIDIFKLKTNANQSAFVASTRGDGSKICQNLPFYHNYGQHRQTSIYFMITPRGIQQRCHSPKIENRLNGPCNKWGSMTNVPPSATELIEPVGNVAVLSGTMRIVVA